MAVDRTTPILIVDDYRTMIRIIRNLLEQLGFTDIDDASDGEAALAKLRTRRFGLVISDWNMEPMSGLTLLETVRADPDLGALPFIMVTAERRPDRLARAAEAGMSDYILKPFTAATLDSKVMTALAG